MKILFPDRIVNRHVGGNTTYARALRDGLMNRGVEVGYIPSGRYAVTTALKETLYGLKSGLGILHYSADTGPLVPTKGPSVTTVHGVASRWIDVARTPTQEWVWRRRVERAIKSTDALITVSESAADDISSTFNFDRQQITVIPHGIDATQYSQQASLSDETGQRIPPKYALYVGNIEPRKNLIELIRAFNRPEVRDLGMPLVIAGKPAWNFAQIMLEISRSDNVIYLGFVSDEDRIALMQQCAVFTFPSLYEGFGLPVLEAMAAGAPTVASRRGSLREVAGPAWEIEHLDAEGISSAIIAALSDGQWFHSVKNRGREWAKNFDWSDSIDMHLRVYAEVLRG